jgi:hypothetical protein
MVAAGDASPRLFLLASSRPYVVMLSVAVQIYLVYWW